MKQDIFVRVSLAQQVAFNIFKFGELRAPIESLCKDKASILRQKSSKF